jgi:hypothetical protein
MQIAKLRSPAGHDGLAPAGRYFAHLARELAAAQERESVRRETLEAEDRALQARYRRASAAREPAPAMAS